MWEKYLKNVLQNAFFVKTPNNPPPPRGIFAKKIVECFLCKNGYGMLFLMYVNTGKAYL